MFKNKFKKTFKYQFTGSEIVSIGTPQSSNFICHELDKAKNNEYFLSFCFSFSLSLSRSFLLPIFFLLFPLYLLTYFVSHSTRAPHKYIYTNKTNFFPPLPFAVSTRVSEFLLSLSLLSTLSLFQTTKIFCRACAQSSEDGNLCFNEIKYSHLNTKKMTILLTLQSDSFKLKYKAELSQIDIIYNI